MLPEIICVWFTGNHYHYARLNRLCFSCSAKHKDVRNFVWFVLVENYISKAAGLCLRVV